MVGSLFGGGAPSPPPPDPEVERLRAERAAQTARDEKNRKAAEESDKARRAAGLYGQRALLSGDYEGFKSNLGV